MTSAKTACLALFALTLVLLSPRAEAASVSLKPVAVVGDEIITEYDLENRVRLNLLQSGLKANATNIPQIKLRILQDLINESVEIKEAEKNGIRINNAQLAYAKQKIEQENKIPPGKLSNFLKSNRVAEETLNRQLRANLGWAALIKKKFASDIIITSQEVDEELKNLRERGAKPVYQVAEIFLPISDDNQEENTEKLATQLFKRISGGEKFANVAKAYSKGATASAGGNVGWVRGGELDDTLDNVLGWLEPGEISSPVRASGGYYILWLQHRKMGDATLNDDVTVTMKQVTFTLPEEKNSSKISEISDLANMVSETTSSCEDFEKIGQKLGGQSSGDLGEVTLSELPPTIRNIVDQLQTGQASHPFQNGNQLMVLMICSREEGKVNDETRAVIEDRLRNKEIENYAEHYLRDLRRQTLIDIK